VILFAFYVILFVFNMILCAPICFSCALIWFLCAPTCFYMLIFDLSVLACFKNLCLLVYMLLSVLRASCNSCYLLYVYMCRLLIQFTYLLTYRVILCYFSDDLPTYVHEEVGDSVLAQWPRPPSNDFGILAWYRDDVDSVYSKISIYNT
jgi:hypothetical protein